MSVRFVIEPLAKAHRPVDFTRDNNRIDSYIRETVPQDVKRNYATCFVAREIATDRVAGFYTLSSSNVPLNEVSEPLAKKMPRYPTVPAVLIGWLGRHSDYAGQGVGGVLLFDAIKTVATAPIGAHAIFADAIDDSAVAFYSAFGFTRLIRRPHTLYLPVTTALNLVSPRRPPLSLCHLCPAPPRSIFMPLRAEGSSVEKGYSFKELVQRFWTNGHTSQRTPADRIREA